jgi:predicted metal-dependent phosphoesterase TrpH
LNSELGTLNSPQGRADVHIHTCHDGWGDGNDTVAEIFDFVEAQTDLTLIALTDHDSTEAGRAGRKLHQKGGYRFDFLPGTEVTTTSGHLLCYFPKDIVDVPSLRSLSSTAAFVHERGGFCVLAHPVYPPWLRRSMLRPHSRTIHMVEAIEVANGGLGNGAQARLAEIGAALQGRSALVGNSDSHHKESIGSVYTLFSGRDARDYRAALSSRETRSMRGRPAPMPREARTFTRRRSMTRPGWVRNVYREVAGGTSRSDRTK